MNTEIPVAAYNERESRAQVGTIRDEWRVRTLVLDEHTPEAQRSILRTCGDRRIDAFSAFALEHRQLRFGGDAAFNRDGAWELYDVYERDTEALGDIDRTRQGHLTVALDVRVLEVWADKHERQERERVAAAARIEQQRREDAEIEAARLQAAASLGAFERLRKGKGGAVAEAWTTFARSYTAEHEAAEDKSTTRLARLQGDAAFREHYAALFAATTVPAKRKAIMAALKRAAEVAP